jgi:hypothetical protein
MRCTAHGNQLTRTMDNDDGGHTLNLSYYLTHLSLREVTHCNYSSTTSKSKSPPTRTTICSAKMASNFEKEPIFLLEGKWDDSTKLPEKYKFLGRNAKAEVCINSGTLGMEFFLEKTLAQFNQAGTRLNWSWEETFLEFQNVGTPIVPPGTRYSTSTSLNLWKRF